MKTHPERSLKLVAAALVVAMIAGIAAEAATAKRQAAKPKPTPFKVLYIGIESGSFASIGLALIHGVVAAARALNQTGGIHGHPVQLTIVDSKGDPATAVSLAQQYLNNGTTWNAVGADLNFLAQALSPIFATKPVLAFGDVAAPTQTVETAPNMFFVGPPQTVIEGGVVAQAQKKGYKTVGIVAPDSASGHTNATTAQGLYQAAGINSSVVFVPTGTIDATPQLQQVMDSKPDALELVGAGSAAAILPARTKLGLTIPTMCDDGCAGSANWNSFSAADRQGVQLITFPQFIEGDPHTTTPAFKLFLKYVNPLEPTHANGIEGPASTYLMLFAARAAAKKCNCIDGPGLVKALEQVPTSKGLSGWIGPAALFSSTNHIVGWQTSDYISIPAGTQNNGFYVTS